MIQLFSHRVYPESIANVTEVLQSGWTGLGPKTKEFEEALASYLDTSHVIGFNSGTAAIEAALTCLNQRPGSYIITTPLTFISTNHSILRTGYIPVFADIEPDTGNIDVESVKRLMASKFVGPRVKALMVVHYGGLPVDMDGVYDIANEAMIDVIEDAAHAMGSEYKSYKIGTRYTRFCCFSFHAVKPLAIGDGGALATYADDVDRLARKLRWCGIDKSTIERSNTKNYLWDYDVTALGAKSHMNDIQAAIGLGQLKHYEEDRKHRAALVELYRTLLKDNDKIMPLGERPDRVSANHIFGILCIDRAVKEGLMQYLAQHDIQTGCHYRPSHLYRMYSPYEKDNDCPNAITFFETEISLPLHCNMTFDDVEQVCNKINKYTKE